MAEDYIAFCEELWRGWLKHGPPPQPAAAELARLGFDLRAMPEPYVCFNAGKKPLLALTTNPGATMGHQRRAAVKVGDGPVGEKDGYAEAARKLGCFYERKLAGRPAGRRIARLLELSCSLRYEGVLQVEACPFHSPSLPMRKKIALVREAETNEGGLVGRYAESLRGFLQHRAVVILQASNKPMERPAGEWLTWIAKVAGLDLNGVRRPVLLTAEATVAAWVSGQPPKALVLMMGGAGLPSDKGLRKLEGKLRELWGLGGR